MEPAKRMLFSSPDRKVLFVAGTAPATERFMPAVSAATTKTATGEVYNSPKYRDSIVADVQEFELAGNKMYGLATPSRGASEVEVWLTRVQPDAQTPIHSHTGEEVIVVLRGRGEARRIGNETITFEAPCTLILPARELHQLANTGREVLEGIAAIPAGSKIFDEHGVEMALPWRV